MKSIFSFAWIVVIGLIFGSAYSQDSTTSQPEDSDDGMPSIQDAMDWIHEYPEYTAMIGMGALIVILVITSVCLICCLTKDRNSK